MKQVPTKISPPLSIGQRIIAFNKGLQYTGSLPEGFAVLNPYLDNPETLEVMTAFYNRFYHDEAPRKFIIGINPSRHGAGVTGVPFTDTKHLESDCGIRMQSARTHEVSSVFVYDMIAQYGGVEAFYKDYYINSPFPLAIVRQNAQGNWLNANYYDDSELFTLTREYMIETLKKHIALGLDTQKVYVLGKKNATFLEKLNKEASLFEKMVVLEHPRYIEQYKSKEKQLYIDKFITLLKT
ncbi:SMUG2 DNA glycosylase family protein [Capnocytophaga gingivalis]|uniref:SMUG2 DNA glycosylase family protein n=1 Tax=Capnocytophaga gingivalis TaxID=1017 RepID=UPI0028F1456B|nr:SMUG2 DNA glycosylase family protein [Capnocytophaga gingivalis]